MTWHRISDQLGMRRARKTGARTVPGRCGGTLAVLLIAGLGLLPGSVKADVEGELIARYKGVYALTQVPLFSECTPHYTDNEVTVTRATRGDGLRFAPGELVRIDKVDVTFSRIDVNIGFSEPYRVTWSDGPFTLYDQRYCKVSLNLALASDVRRNTERAAAAIEALLLPFRTQEEARRAKSWNGRKVEPYPKGWEKTKAEYDAWKAEQVNGAVQAKIDSALEQANRAIDQIADTSDALTSFAAGLRARRYDSFSSCETMLNDSFSPSYSGGKDVRDSRAYAEGQRLGHFLSLARELRRCFLPVPAGR